MANNSIGLWVNYATQKIYEIDEHENYIRRGNNAKKIGVPDFVIAEFKNFEPIKDRDRFLLYILDKSPLMRVREHGNYASFEFSDRKADKAFEAINKVGNYLGFGMYTGLYIVNHADNTSASLTWQDFKKSSQWADKVSELSESFVHKKLFPTIFDHVKEAKEMTESQKKEADILDWNSGDVDLRFDLSNHAVIFDGEQPICYIENFERWNNGISCYAWDPKTTKKQREAALQWIYKQVEKTDKKFIVDENVLKRHLYYNDVVLNKNVKKKTDPVREAWFGKEDE